MAGGRWAEESEQETPYDEGEEEGASIRSYLVVSMLVYMKESTRETEGKRKRKRGLEQRLSSARRI